VSAPELERAIEQTLSQREYTWRMPRQAAAESEQGWFGQMMGAFLKALRQWFQDVLSAVRSAVLAVIDWCGRMMEKLFRRSVSGAPGSEVSGTHVGLQLLVYLLLAAALSAVVILISRYLQQRRQRSRLVTSLPVAAVPDLRDDNVMANQMPEEGWLELARALMAEGDLRLALRAFYLAGLAHLASREVIQIARFKTNRDYEQEVCRRARAQPELQAAFAANVSQFDRAWYGLHEVSQELLQAFQANLERIRAC
jgi:hypothetical protein